MGRGAVVRHGERKGDFLAGKYLLEDCLGVGGMGEVYRATNMSLGRKVAIKLLSPEYVHIEDDVLRFLREARAAAAVRHPNVVDVIDVARDDDGTPFIVQELLAGEDLEHYLKIRNGRLSCLEALEIMIPVADAVAAAHAQDVVHRDLKPANIFLARDRNKITPKVLDFGACLFPTIAERSAKEVRMLIGTPHYMAPEQIVSKQDVDSRSDVWALGIILYEMIVGETPFEAESANAVLQLVKTRPVPSLLERVKDAPRELDALIARCTKRDRLARYRDASELHAEMVAVRQSMRGVPSSSRAQTLLERGDEDEAPAASQPRSNPGSKRGLGFEIPSLDAPDSSKPKRGGLLTLSSPGSEPPPTGDDFDLSLPSDRSFGKPPPASAERPIVSASPVRLRSDPPGVRELDPDEKSGPPSLELGARPSSWPPTHKQVRGNNEPSSLPPVLDPRGAFGGGRLPSPPPPPPVPRESFSDDRPPISQSGPASAPVSSPISAASPISVPSPISATKPRPPAVLAQDSARARHVAWSTAETVKLAATVAVPAILGFVVVRQIPAIGHPIGGALRGDSTISSGLMAVAALVGAAVLGARSVLGTKKSRSLYVAAGGAVLFGIVMIIVTFAASEAAELGVPQSMAGISTLVAPLAPLALAVGAVLEAKASWTDPYSRREAIRAAIFASVMLLLALAFSPAGAVRAAPPRAPTTGAKS